MDKIKECKICDREYPESKHNFEECYSLDPDWDLEQITTNVKNKKCDVFTPSEQVQIMQQYLRKGAVLDPCVGVGNLIAGITSPVDAFDIEFKYLKSISRKNVTKYHNNFLTCEIKRRYDNVIMNPPYIRIQDLDIKTRNYISQNYPILSGNFDIYYAFILKSLSLLNEHGICVSINPSSILFNKSSKKMMGYLIRNRLIQEIIDYGSEKIFDDADIYCCIMVFTKEPKSHIIYNNTRIPYDKIIDSIFIHKGDKIGKRIQTYNGIATLCDKVYIHKNKIFDEPCIKKIFKVSKNEIRYIIYPYSDDGIIIPEALFKTQNPRSYAWLLSNKEKLSNRDKGKKKYETWYAFGRKQGLLKKIRGEVLYISTICNENYRLHRKKQILHYSGICICCDNIDVIQSSISRPDNKKLLHLISSKRGGGWFNVSSTNIKQLIL
jgi:hypothetical protein